MGLKRDGYAKWTNPDPMWVATAGCLKLELYGARWEERLVQCFKALAAARAAGAGGFDLRVFMQEVGQSQVQLAEMGAVGDCKGSSHSWQLTGGQWGLTGPT